MSCLTNQENNIIKSLEAWLEDNVDQGTDIAFDNDGAVTSVECLPVLSKIIKCLTPTAISAELKKSLNLKKSRGHDCMRCTICDENDNFVILTDGVIECANCGDKKGRLAIQSH